MLSTDRAKGCAELDGAGTALMLRFLHKSHRPVASPSRQKAAAILPSSHAVMWKLNSQTTPGAEGWARWCSGAGRSMRS